MKYCYCICYIERKYYKNINKDIKRRGFKHIRAIIPEVQIIKKARKNKTFYEEVPVLFNYGFIKMPVENAYSRPFLNKLKKAIPGIRHWLKSVDSMFPKKIRKRIDNGEDFDDFSKVATCTREEVNRFKKIAHDNQKYTLEEKLRVEEGMYITLDVYPYRGTQARVIKLNHAEDTATLELYPRMGKFIVTIPLDHVYYSAYRDSDPDIFIKPFGLDPERIIK